MKKLLNLLLAIIATTALAQNDIDVLRYSRGGVGGDARFMALGGSMGALGANLSTINYNPAGIAIYRKGEFNMSAGMRFAGVDAQHYGTTTRDLKTNLFLGTFGFASAWEEASPYKDETSKKKFKNWSRRHSIGMSYNKIVNFNQNINIAGNTYQKTIVDDFLSSAQTYMPNQLSPFYEGMAFNTYLIDTFPGTLNEYGTYFYTDKSYSQNKILNIKGSMNEYSLAYGYAKDNKTYFGGSLGIISGKWNYTSIYSESDFGDSTEYFKSLELTDVVQTRGIGVNLKLGVISRLSESFRVGAYVHTPSAIALNDNYNSEMVVRYDSLFGVNSPTINDSSGSGSFRYRINTPMKAGASIAYLYEKLLAINIDAEYINYQQGTISSRDYVYTDVNNEIRKKYNSTFNFRAGVELNTKPIVFRLGYASYGSPFGDILSGMNVKSSYSGGIGIRKDEKKFFDIAVVFDRYNEEYYIYGPKNIDASRLNYKTTQIVFTYGIKF